MSHQFLADMFGGDGQTAVVIGGTGTLGAENAYALSQCGYNVVVAGRNEDKGRAVVDRITQTGADAKFLTVDAKSEDSLKELVDASVDAFSHDNHREPVSVVINAVATKNVGMPNGILDFDAAAWNEALEANATSVALTFKVFGQHMIDNNVNGRGVAYSSVTTPTPLTKVRPYSASKAAVDSIIKSSAVDLAPRKIRINGIRPGFFPAEQNRAVLDEVRRASIARQTPLKRQVSDACTGYGEPKDLSPAIILLASAANPHMTGEIITVDGGFSAFTF